MLQFNKKDFGKKKRAVTTSGNALRQNVQDLIEMGLSHYAQHGDTCYLTEAMNCTIATRTIRTVAVQAYIQKVANVAWTKTKKSRSFSKKKNDDGTAQDAVIDLVYVGENKWFEDSENLGLDKPDMDFDAQLKSLITRTEKALEAGKIDNPDHAREALSIIKPLVEQAA